MPKQHPVFYKYTRSWLAERTGFSKGHLSAIATGRIPCCQLFIDRVCSRIGLPEEVLFLPNTSPRPPEEPE